MDETIITWNVTNWITVVLMVLLMWLLFATGAQIWRNWRGSSSNEG